MRLALLDLAGRFRANVRHTDTNRFATVDSLTFQPFTSEDWGHMMDGTQPSLSGSLTSSGTSARNAVATVNIQAVANAAGVSKTTVSHVLSGKRPVSSSTRKHVEKVMAEMGFQPNFFAQALNHNRSNTIGLIVQDITNPFYPALARGLQTSVSDQQQVVMLFDAGAGGRLTHTLISEAIKRRVDGLVVAVSNVDDDLVQLAKAAIPVVAVGSGTSNLPIDWVTADDERIASDAVMYLHLAGHTHIATITGPLQSAPGKPRLLGYQRAMADLGLLTGGADVVMSDWTRAGGFASMQAILRTRIRPSAVFCANDLMAIGAMEAALLANVRIPEDVAIVGVDDIDAAGLLRPSLTTVRVPAEEIGRAVGELLLHRIAEGITSSHRHILVQHKLISRDSA